MNAEQKIRMMIRRQLLSEAELTVRPGRGGYKKAIRQAGALAKENPNELMKRLGVDRVDGDKDIDKMFSLLEQAIKKTKEMSVVFGEPLGRKDKSTGYVGIRIKKKLPVPPRDARKYIEHTVIGAQNSGKTGFTEPVQIEILPDGDIIAYFSDKEYSWGRGTKQNQEEKSEPNGKLLAEPDITPGRKKGEASVAGAVSGPVTPLGTGPTYPDKPKRKKKKSIVDITRGAFGGNVKK